MNNWRRVAIITLYFVDCVLHTQLILGWSSTSEVLRRDGFFAKNCTQSNIECNQSQNQQIGRVLVVSSSLVGYVLFILGAVRDAKPDRGRYFNDVLFNKDYCSDCFICRDVISYNLQRL